MPKNIKSKLSEYQMTELRKLPFVKNVTEEQISFTDEFKRHFHEEHMKGKKPVDIVAEAGIDPELLSGCRIRSLQRRAHEYYWRYCKPAVKQAELVAKITKTPEKRLLMLEHELAYTKQELEFLKKIYLADREERQKCGNMQNPK